MMRNKVLASTITRLVGIVAAAVVLALVPASGAAQMNLIKQATGKGSIGDRFGENKNEKELSDTINRVVKYVQIAGFLLIPLAAAGAGIAWMLGSPKGPRYMLSIIGAGLLIGSASVIQA